jgi:signal transduction histidine kinase/ligand-binding sensor domain-containing protein
MRFSFSRRNTFILVLLLPFALLGQPRKFDLQKTEKHLSILDGLSNRHINSTFIDKHRKIWFLTENKIGQFEFGKIKNYQLVDKFSNRGFNAATEDEIGNFWLSENYEWYYPFDVQNCVIFNPISKKVTSIEKYVHQKIAIRSIISDAQNHIFLSTSNGQIYRFDSKKQVLQLIISLSKMPIKLLYAGSKGLIACVEQDSRKDNLLVHLSFEGKILSQTDVKGQFVRSVVEAENRLFYITHQPKTMGMKEIGGSFVKYFPVSRDGYLSNIIYIKNKQNFILNEGNSLRFLDKNFNLVEHYKQDVLIHHIIYDEFGNYILSTNNGVNIIQFNEKKIRTFLENKDPEKLNENYSCRKILKIDKENVIVNTNKRRQLINLKSSSVKSLHDFKNENGENPRFVLTVLQDKDGDIVFGEDALVKTNLRTNKDETLCTLDSTKIWAISAYKDGYLLGLEKHGVIYYDKKTKNARPFSKINHEFDNAIIYDFFTINHELYIASEAGFYQVLNENIIKTIPFSVEKGLQMTCFSLQKDKQNPTQLFIATLNGIWIFDLVKRTVRPFIQDKSYHHKKYLSAYTTKNGVWASSEEGIWHFDAKGNLLKIYTVTDGLTSNECNRLAHFQDENDVLYFGGMNGLNIMNPSDFSTAQAKVFDLKIDSVYTYEGKYKNRFFANFNVPFLQLNRAENSIEVAFSYEDFKYDCSKKYFYRTDKSLVKDWQLLTDRRLILNNIDNGMTTIEIMVVSCDNYVDAKTKKIVINRPNPLYLTWYFWFFVLVLLALLIWMSVKYSTYQLKRRNEFLQKKVNEQTHTLKESLALKETLLSLLVHDVRYPVQSFYDLSKKLAYLTQKNDHERLFLLGKETENKSRKVLWLIDELVYWVKSTNKNWESVRQDCDLGKIINQIFDIYSDEMGVKSLIYKIDNQAIRATVDQGLFVIVIRNLIFNAIIHSKSSTVIEVSITLTAHKNQIIIRNEFEGNTQNLELGLGVGMTILAPILRKANFIIETSNQQGVFTNKLNF